MNKDLRDYLLEMFCTLNAFQNHISRNPIVRAVNIVELKKISELKYRTAQTYHSLADDKDLSLLDEDGYPTDFQLKRMSKIMVRTSEEFDKRIDELSGKGRVLASMRHGDLIAIPKSELSKCDDCGHVHD